MWIRDEHTTKVFSWFTDVRVSVFTNINHAHWFVVIEIDDIWSTRAEWPRRWTIYITMGIRERLMVLVHERMQRFNTNEIIFLHNGISFVQSTQWLGIHAWLIVWLECIPKNDSQPPWITYVSKFARDTLMRVFVKSYIVRSVTQFCCISSCLIVVRRSLCIMLFVAAFCEWYQYWSEDENSWSVNISYWLNHWIHTDNTQFSVIILWEQFFTLIRIRISTFRP